MTDLYNTIGKTYTATRAADPRITARLIELLDLQEGAAILDVGAGTGNYSQAIAELAYEVTAVEPSEVMRKQGKQHPRLHWHAGDAEHLAFADDAFDGVVMTLCMHHFVDWHQALREAIRVTGSGPIVVLTFDAETDTDFWLFDYFPSFREKDKEWFPKMDVIRSYCERSLARSLDVIRFPLPPDLQDHFAAAGWARPEIYLEESYRAGISSFATVNDQDVRRGLNRLADDLRSGQWDARYGNCRSAEELDVGYVFLVMR